MQIDFLQSWSSPVASNFEQPVPHRDAGSSCENEEEPAKDHGSFVSPESNLGTPQVRFEDLAKGSQRVLIRYGDAVYELKCTRNGRLVLNK